MKKKCPNQKIPWVKEKEYVDDAALIEELLEDTALIYVGVASMRLPEKLDGKGLNKIAKKRKIG